MGSEELGEQAGINVLASSFDVDDSNGIVENRNYVLSFGGSFAQLPQAPSHHLFAFLSMAEERVELIYDVRLAVFLSTHQLLFHRLFHALLTPSSPRDALGGLWNHRHGLGRDAKGL